MITTALLVGLNSPQKAVCHPSEEKAGVSALCKVRLLPVRRVARLRHGSLFVFHRSYVSFTSMSDKFLPIFGDTRRQ